MRVLIVLLISIYLQADIFDFWHLRGAKRAYKEGNFTKAIDDFKKLDLSDDHTKYDLANSYYKAKKFKEAKSLYEQISDKSLLFNKWHNLGNTLAFLNDIDGAIKAYKEALKIKEDKDTRYNLELLEKLKKKNEQKKQKKKKQKKKDNKKKKQDQKKNKDHNKNKDQKKKENKSDKNKDDKHKNKKDKNKPSKDEKQNKDQQKKQKSAKQKPKKPQKPKDLKKIKKQKLNKKPGKPEPISDKEVKKYLKMLDSRGVNTLLIPLNSKGADDEELKNW